MGPKKKKKPFIFHHFTLFISDFIQVSMCNIRSDQNIWFYFFHVFQTALLCVFLPAYDGMPSCMGWPPARPWPLARGWGRLGLVARRCVTVGPWRTVSSHGDRRLSEDKRGSLNRGQRLSSPSRPCGAWVYYTGRWGVSGGGESKCEWKREREEKTESARQHLQTNKRSRSDYDHPWGEELKVLGSEKWVWPRTPGPTAVKLSDDRVLLVSSFLPQLLVKD